MRSALLLVALVAPVALAACSPEVAAQLPCGDEGFCGDDEVCDRSPAAPTCIPATGDLDGDGIANLEDLCPQLAGAEQFDEDNDGIGDACDRCPIAPPRDAPDTDGDDVDGICDPEPELAGNRIVAFAGFREPPTNWTIPTGWQVLGGELVATIPGVGTDLFVTPIVGSNRLAIEASYRIDSIGATGTPAVSLVARDRRPAGSTTLACGVTKIGTTERVQLSTDIETTSETAIGLFDDAALYRAGFLIDGGQVACAVIANAETMKSTGGRGGGEQMTEAGLAVSNATARFQWVMVIAR